MGRNIKLPIHFKKLQFPKLSFQIPLVACHFVLRLSSVSCLFEPKRAPVVTLHVNINVKKKKKKGLV